MLFLEKKKKQTRYSGQSERENFAIHAYFAHVCARVPLKFDFRLFPVHQWGGERGRKVEAQVRNDERRGVNFGGRGSYGINDCLVQREFEDEFRHPCNENTANEADAEDYVY